VTAGLRALIVEDNPDDVELVKMELERGGYQLDIRQVGTLEALRRSLNEAWDIIYSDYQLDGFNGEDVLEVVRRERGLDTPFIVVSGSVGEDVAVRAMRAGADDYFRKEHMERLAPATARCLRDAENRRRLAAAERDKRALERRLRTMFNVVPIPIAIVEGASNVCTFQNTEHERLFGPLHGQPLGGERPALATETDIAETRTTGATVIRRERIVKVASRAGAPAERIMNVLFVPVRDDPDGPMDAVTIVAVDNTREVHLRAEAEGARAQFEQANRLKDEFLLTVSHELRTPLNAILGWSAMLRQGGLDPERRARAVETIERSAREQTRLVEELLDISRIATGKLRVVPQALDLASVIRAAVDAVKPAAEAKRILIGCHFDESGSAVQGDPERLQQVIWNLLTNAIKFTPERGAVSCQLTREGSQAVVRVVDTGEGIAPEFLPHVFDRFRQGDSSITRRYGGLGIGLAIAKDLVEAHGGTISVESPGVGSGATFTVKLPLPG